MELGGNNSNVSVQTDFEVKPTTTVVTNYDTHEIIDRVKSAIFRELLLTLIRKCLQVVLYK